MVFRVFHDAKVGKGALFLTGFAQEEHGLCIL